MLLQLRYIKDIIELLEATLEIKSVYSLSYALHYPGRSHKPSSELPSACKMGLASTMKCLQETQEESSTLAILFLGLQREYYFFTYLPDLLTAYDVC